MDVVSSAFAVVSLAIQLVETGEKISKFLSSIQEAPNEITKLCETLDQLNSSLKQVGYLLEQQYLVLRLPGSPVFITNALGTCEKRIRTLEDTIQKVKVKEPIEYRKRVQRSWAILKFVSKKEDILEIQGQLRDAEIGLQTAMLSNSWQLQMHHISLPSSGSLKATVLEEPSSVVPINSALGNEIVPTKSCYPKDRSEVITKETNQFWYRSLLGSVCIQSKSRWLRKSNARKPGTQVITKENTITVQPSFFRRIIELQFLNSFGRISRSLSTYPILEENAPIFKFFSNGDLQGLQAALSSGSVSPFSVDQDGWSLLHYAAIYQQNEICSLLLQLGVDPDRRDNFGSLAMRCFDPRTHIPTSNVDALRLLTQAQKEISLRDLNQFWSGNGVTPEAAEFMLSQALIPSEFTLFNDEDAYPILAAALKNYSRALCGYRHNESDWELFIRRFLRKGVGLHSPVSNQWGDDYGTPLDELFMYTSTPFEGETAAERWLGILSSEGYDIQSYLEEEQALHAAQIQCTRHSGYPDETPRQLQFHWGSDPSVSWVWLIDPDSSTFLVREEFKHMIHQEKSYYWKRWETDWPIRYPAWTDIHRDQHKELYERAQERATRRMEKKLWKAARAQGLRKRDKMPGAWPV